MTLLLNLLKGFSLDIPARVAELKARIEQRVEDAADQAVHVVQDIAVTVALVCCAAITASSGFASERERPGLRRPSRVSQRSEPA